MPQIPLLIYTDAPDHNTGLARICRDLTSQIHASLSDHFRVATLGVFGRGSARFPWPQYTSNGPEDALYNLQQITDDFFGGGRGIVFSITPPSWLFPLTLPQYMDKEGQNWANYVEWMKSKPFDLWSYLAIESHGPLGQYGPTTRAILSQIHRRVYYSKWGADIGLASGVDLDRATHIHHGIDTNTWQPSPPDVVRKFRSELGVEPSDLLLGCVATNTRRKLLPLLFESAYLLRHQLGSSRLKLWINTDVAIREYNLKELAACFNFELDRDVLILSTNARRPDQWLANMYSACDLTCLPTAGEGFGYPVIESLACGTPVVTGQFGAQSELLRGFRDSWLCPVLASHLITNSTLVEPIYDPRSFASCLLMAWTELRQNVNLREECRQHALNWDWPRIWPHWHQWLLAGLETETMETPNVNQPRIRLRGAAVSQFVPAPQPEGQGVASPVGGDADSTRLQPADGDSGGVDSGAPIGVAGAADRP